MVSKLPSTQIFNVWHTHFWPQNKQQGTNVAHNLRGGLLIDLTIVAIALLLRYTLSMSLKLTDITQWNVGAVVLEQF